MAQADDTRDTELLETFVNQRDVAAFAELVRRHHGTVMSVCRRILGNTQDAEDAFQAVFVALAKHAPKLAGHPALGAWLHRVACGTALDAVRRRTTREKKERETSTMQEEIGEPSQVTEETGALLHAELNALPERYRRPLILFHIEERSLEETGRQLNVPVNTVSTWLRRGREKLRARLLRRGVAVSVAGLGAILSAESVSAGVAEGLVVSTAKIAAIAAGKAAAAAGCGMSANVAAMTKGAMKMIFMAKVKVACLVGSGVVLATATTAVVAEKTVEAQRATEENKAKLAQVTWEKWEEKPSNRYPVQLGPKFGYMDREGKIVIAPEYVLGATFRCGRATVYTGWDAKLGATGQCCIDTAGREVETLSLAALSNSLPFKPRNVSVGAFREGLATVTCQLDTGTTQKVGTTISTFLHYRYGYVDVDGRWAIPPIFVRASRFQDGRAVVSDTNGVNGVVDRSGRMTLTVPPDFFASDNRGQGEGFLSIGQRSVPQGVGYITENGYRIPCRFWQAERFSEGFAAVALPAGQWRYIDKSGEYAFAGEFKDAAPFSEGLACVKDEKGKWGCIDRSGKTVVSFIYDTFGVRDRFANDGYEHVPRFLGGCLPVCVNNRWGYIDRNNKVVVPLEFDSAEGPVEGLCRVTRRLAVHNLNERVPTVTPWKDGNSKNALWFDSYYDATGKLVFDGLAKAVEMGIVSHDPKAQALQRTGKGDDSPSEAVRALDAKDDASRDAMRRAR
jgi:RNA polymerase sigma factor (sigma-70 family)